MSGALRAIAAASSSTTRLDVGRVRPSASRARGRRFVRVEESAGDEHVLGAREAEVLDEPRAVLERQTVAERAGDGHAEAGVRRAHAQVARQRDRAPGAGGDAFAPGRSSGTVTRSSRATTRFEAPLVLEAVLAGRERRELAMSVPVQNTSPAARMTNARTAASASTRSQASTSASYIAHVMALPASGRLIVRCATGPADEKIASDGFTMSPHQGDVDMTTGRRRSKGFACWTSRR